MKKILLNFIKSAAIIELEIILNRNLTTDEKNTLLNYLIKARDKAKEGLGKEIIKIIIDSLN